MKKTIKISILISVVAFFFFIKNTTTGLSNPVNFFDIPWGWDKGVLLYIVLMCSIAFGAYAYFIGDMINRYKNRQYRF